MRTYEPNDFDRQLVSQMALYCSREKIAAHIINTRTRRPINRKTLEKHYSRELEGAQVEITNDAVKSWRRLIEQDHWPATYLALRNGGGHRRERLVNDKCQPEMDHPSGLARS
jgi:hypothetical protein